MTNGRTDGPTKQAVESPSTRLKRQDVQLKLLWLWLGAISHLVCAVASLFAFFTTALFHATNSVLCKPDPIHIVKKNTIIVSVLIDKHEIQSFFILTCCSHKNHYKRCLENVSHRWSNVDGNAKMTSNSKITLLVFEKVFYCLISVWLWPATILIDRFLWEFLSRQVSVTFFLC